MPTPHYPATEAARLRWARKQRRLTQEQLAALTRLDHQTVWRHENGGRMGARARRAYSIVLGLSDAWLQHGIGAMPGTATDEVVQAYLRANKTPNDIAAMLLRFPYEALGVRHLHVGIVARIRDLIELNRTIEPRFADVESMAHSAE